MLENRILFVKLYTIFFCLPYISVLRMTMDKLELFMGLVLSGIRHKIF